MYQEQREAEAQGLIYQPHFHGLIVIGHQISLPAMIYQDMRIAQAYPQDTSNFS